MFLYSPLEQFEPIPLITLFLGGINLSITNVTIIFIYIVLVLCYFINGYLFSINNNKVVKLVHRKGGTLSVDSVSNFDFLSNIYNDTLNSSIFLNFHSNKIVSYLNYLGDTYTRTMFVREFKGDWLGLNALNLPFLKSEYSREFNRVLFNILSTKDITTNNLVFFNNIQLYFNNFLNNLNYLATISQFDSIKQRFTTSNILYYFSTREVFARYFVPLFNIYAFENIYNAILGMVKENIRSRNSLRFFPMVFSIFLFILVANLLGLVPYSSTVTSYLIVTLAMSIMVLVGVNVIDGRLHGLTFFGHFLPAGCPFALYPLIIPIEFISYVFRVVSLSVRLFANMMAGHTLLAVLAGLCVCV
jgi:ATP synthase subunit 6